MPDLFSDKFDKEPVRLESNATVERFVQQAGIRSSCDLETAVDIVRAMVKWLPLETDNVRSEPNKIAATMNKMGISFVEGEPLIALVTDSPNPGDLSGWELLGSEVDSQFAKIWRFFSNDAFLFQEGWPWIICITHDGGLGFASLSEESVNPLCKADIKLPRIPPESDMKEET